MIFICLVIPVPCIEKLVGLTVHLHLKGSRQRQGLAHQAYLHLSATFSYNILFLGYNLLSQRASAKMPKQNSKALDLPQGIDSKDSILWYHESAHDQLIKREKQPYSATSAKI